jgi:bifunctional DNA-binding transcriptional regulator/antitoxin component of YhaV-PrlF toxin-antitoxin module
MKIFLLTLLTSFAALGYERDYHPPREPNFLKESGTRWTYMTKEDCKRSDAQIVLKVGVEDMSPRMVYVREGDKVCLIVNSEEVRVSLSIEKYPVSVTVQRNKSEMTYFKANQIGEFKLICRGCADGKNFNGAKLVVESKESFDKAQEEYLRKEAEEYRQRSLKRRFER